MADVVYDYGVPSVLSRELNEILDRVESTIRRDGCGGGLPRIIVKDDCSHALSDRNFAAIRVGHTTRLYLCRDLADQPISRIRGVLWHEVGHILCWMYGPPTDWEVPGGFGLDDEQLTDLAVCCICGIRIYYDDELVQRAGRGARGRHPRPKGLK